VVCLRQRCVQSSIWGVNAMLYCFPVWEDLGRKKQAYFSAMESTSAASPFLRCAGGIDPGANTARCGHSYSVNASASVPISQLPIVCQ